MDVNGLPFWQVADAQGFGLGANDGGEPRARNLQWDERHQALRLAGQEPAPKLNEDEAFARAWILQPSAVCDTKGSFAWWDDEQGKIMASGFAPGAAAIAIQDDADAAAKTPSDLCYAADILHITRNGRLMLADMRDRWPLQALKHKNFSCGLVAAAGDNAIWLLDQATGKLARLQGTPMPARQFSGRKDEAFRAKPQNPDPLDIAPVQGVSIPAPYEAVAMNGNANGELAILCWNPSEEAVIFLFDGRELRLGRPLEKIKFPLSLVWNSDDEICLTVSHGPEIANRVYAFDKAQILSGSGPVRPNGQFYPLVNQTGLGLCNASDGKGYYVSQTDVAAGEMRLQRLRPISRSADAMQGGVLLGPFDSGDYDCIWHRLYLEASFAERTGMRIWALADNQGVLPDIPKPGGREDNGEWALHLAGNAESENGDIAYPKAAWSQSKSEISGHDGFSTCPQKQDHAGLFTLLLQHAGRHVRRITGRYLYLYFELTGDGRHSPELFALRCYAKRLSYRDEYLPDLYGEPLSRPDGKAAGAATPPDFLERFLHLFEGPLTEIEGRIAGSWKMTDPAAAPDSGLHWLAQWTGVDSSGYSDPAKLRQRLLAASALRRMHGTLGGLRVCLEIETGGQMLRGGSLDPDRPVPRPGNMAQISLNDNSYRALVLSAVDPRSGHTSEVMLGGGVTRGEIMVVEGFRLRRTFSTLLGVDLEDESDPLMLGLTRSGNSIVGDSLFVGEQADDSVNAPLSSDDQAALLALFKADLPKSESDRKGIEDFYRKLAHTVLVLVRGSVPLADRERIKQAAVKAAPAHVELSFVDAQDSFITGIASLIGVDSFLDEPKPSIPVEIQISALGAGDVLTGTGQLDRRSDAPVSMPPVARAEGPSSAIKGSQFWLNAANSEAAKGRTVDRYIWTWT